MNKPVILLGSGGHAKVVLDMLRESNVDVVGITDLKLQKGSSLYGVPVLGSDSVINEMDPSLVSLVIGVGHLPDGKNIRRDIYIEMKRKGYSFCTVKHPSAIVANDSDVGEGVQIMAGVVIQPGSKIGANSIINTSVSIDHDCVIGQFSHVAPGAVVCGGVDVGDSTFIGANATIGPQVVIGEGAVVGAASLLLMNIPPYHKWIGKGII